MDTYHKIQTALLRDPANKHKTLLEGQWAKPEFKYLNDHIWQLTEKVDGTNIRVMFKQGANAPEFNGKSDNAQLPAPLVARLREMFDDKQQWFEENFQHDICLYGEGYGGKIQKGSKYKQEQDFVLFDILFNNTMWAERETLEGIAGQIDVPVVPIVGHGCLFEALELCEKGFNSRWGEFTAEGVIARPLVEMFNRYGERIITKIKCTDFAVQQEPKAA